MFKLFINKSKSSFARNKLFGVDLAVFEPASPLVKGVVLPHKLQAQVHKSIVKQKKPLFQGLPSLTSGLARNSYGQRLMPQLYSHQIYCQ